MLNALGISIENINPSVQIEYFVVGESEKLSRAQHLSGKTNLEYFESGEFLEDREGIDNQELIERIKNLAQEDVPGIYELRKDRFLIGWMFNDLIRFRKQIYEIAHPWGGFDEGFDISLYYGKVHQENLKSLIRENTAEIDEILCLIIDPKRKQISEKDLIEKYNYDTVNLEKIDLDWRIANY